MLVLMMSGLTLSAQVEKGSWFVNGLNIMSYQVGSVRSAFPNEPDSKSTFSSFSIGPYSAIGPFAPIPSLAVAPSLNYGFTNQLTGGIFLDVTLWSEKDSTKYKSSGIMFGPIVRYYLVDHKKFLPFVEGRLGIGTTSSKFGTTTSDKSNLLGWHLGAGATYFFTPRIGADFTLGYENIVDKVKNSDQKTTYGFVQFGTGILVVF